MGSSFRIACNMNLPPSITRVADEASPRIGPLRFRSTVDPESLTGRHLRRPTPFGRIFRTLDTITESASVTTRFVDGPVVEACTVLWENLK